MARVGSRRLLKSLGFTSLITFTGATTVLLTSKTEKPPSTLNALPLQRTSSGEVIAPKFPKIKSRAEQLADLRKANATAPTTEIYDLLIIGGGATGSGIALDAVTRGLKVALVERDDFASGTSSKSTKLVHGGVRYLEKAVWNLDYGQYSLVKEALRERKNFLNTAPHLTSSLPILLPLQSYLMAPYFWMGTKCYDLLARAQGQSIESSYILSKQRALEAFPMLKKDLVGALVYYDGQQDDSRMNVSLALTAALYGATTVNHLEVTSLEKKDGKLCGAKVRNLIAEKDGDSEPEFSIRAKGIINAAGPFVDAIEHMDDSQRRELVAPAEGVHVVLPGHFAPADLGLLDASTSDGRVMFMLPWQGQVIAGTTDTPGKVDNNPQAKEQDISFILKEVSKYLSPEVRLQRSDVLAAWSGIRPLIRDPKSKNTESLVRNHLVAVSDSGLLTCAGGKWTTYRQMAEDAVDKAIEVFDLKPKVLQAVDISGSFQANEQKKLDGSCKTIGLRVLGAHGYTPFMFMDLIRQYNLDTDVAKHLAQAYGDRAWEVAALSSSTSDENASTDLKLSPRHPILKGEVKYAIQNEYAQTATDFLARRTRLSFLDVEATLTALPEVVDMMGEELSWSEHRKQAEWNDTVSFLSSMGLPANKMGITREEVLKHGQQQTLSANKQPIITTVTDVSENEVEGVAVPMPA